MRQVLRAIILTLLMLPVLAVAQDATPSTEDETAPVIEAPTTPPPEWQICNETSFILRLAIAQGQGDNFHVKGWKKIHASECISEPSGIDETRFLFAESDSVHNGGIREWAGQVPICVNPEGDFDITTNVSCALQGLETRNFLRINPEEPITKLVEPDDFKDKAETAGLQRLMQDAGFEITRVDGINGRRTRNTFRQFLKDQQVDTELPIFDQMDALAQLARSNHDLTGLTVCNLTEDKSWIAIGYREDGSWQSRGWWTLEGAGCIRPWSKDLQGVEMHLYAQQGDFNPSDKGDGLDSNQEQGGIRVLKNPIETTNNFCVAEAKFSALGREYCIDQGYVPVDFRPLVVEDSGLKINLTEDDFVPAPSGGLRQ